MDRRLFLQAAALAAAPGLARAQAAPPAYPPPDARSVWLVGDSGRVTPKDTAARALGLLTGEGREQMDGYLKGGAVEALEKAFAAFLGKEDCAFFPTGTMANAVAIRVLCAEHRHAVVPYESHVFRDEADTVQRLAGINCVPLGRGGVGGTTAEITAAISDAENGPYPLKVGCLMVESPVRRADGQMVTAAQVAELSALAKAHGVRMHLDGARLLLAPPGLDVKAYAAPFDTVYVSLYKYLDAPFGAVLAGRKADIEQAREWRHVYGGTILEGWLPAAIALDSLKTFPARIARAHQTGDALFAALKAKGFAFEPMTTPSNIRLLKVSDAQSAAIVERGRAVGVRIAKAKDGRMPIYVNETLSRRPAEEYLKLFTG